MSEREPEVKINTKDGEVLVRRENGSLYKHMGHAALFDHVFVVTGESSGFYIFRGREGFEDLEKYMLANAYPSHVNLVDVSDTDRRVYMSAATADLADTFPDEWDEPQTDPHID